jgi:hypothetical protein
MWLPVLSAALFTPVSPVSVSAADAAWSALPMPQPVGNLVDMAVSPSQDGLIYLLTFDNGHILWRTINDGSTWQRILKTGDLSLSAIDRVAVARDGTLYVAGSSSTGPSCVKSTDTGQTFTVVNLPIAVDSSAGFAAFNNQASFYSSYDGTRSRVWRTANGASFANTIVASVALTIIEPSPNFGNDNTLVAAGGDGNVSISTDRGATFSGLQQSPLTGDHYLAFAGDYASNKYIYAASRTPGAGIWRLKVGEPAWNRIDSGLPAGTIISGLSVSGSGVIYAATANQAGASSGGLVRKTPVNPAWDTARNGLPAGAVLWGLYERGNKLYSLDTANNRIMTYTDTLASPVELLSPQTGTPGLGAFSSGTVGGIDLVWRNPGGAAGFQWQVSDIPDISAVRFEGTITTETVRLKGLDPGVTYFWRVRATSPLLGPWSTLRNFTTALGAPVLQAPGVGAVVLLLQPPFQWQVSSGATTYELMLSTASDFHVLAASTTSINGNVWQPKVALTPMTAYFWKVRAIGVNTFSSWSAVSAFTTAAPATSTAPPITTTSSAPPTTTPPAPTTTAAQLSTTTAPTPAETFSHEQTATQSVAEQPIMDTSLPGLVVVILIGMGGLSLAVVLLIIASERSRRK